MLLQLILATFVIIGIYMHVYIVICLCSYNEWSRLTPGVGCDSSYL